MREIIRYSIKHKSEKSISQKSILIDLSILVYWYLHSLIYRKVLASRCHRLLDESNNKSLENNEQNKNQVSLTKHANNSSIV
jgi:hypothetical protein